MPRSTRILMLVDDVIARWRCYRNDARTRRIVSNLPPQIRKDIGWPDVLPDHGGRRRQRS